MQLYRCNHSPALNFATVAILIVDSGSSFIVFRSDNRRQCTHKIPQQIVPTITGVLGLRGIEGAASMLLFAYDSEYKYV